jgi:hypothetical protein
MVLKHHLEGGTMLDQKIDGFVDLDEAELQAVDGGAWYDIVNAIFTQILPAIGAALQQLFSFGVSLYKTIDGIIQGLPK